MATDVRATESIENPPATGTMPVPLQGLLFAWISGVIYMALFGVPQVEGLGLTSAVLYFHVPLAWIGAFGLLLAAVYSGIYLKTRRTEWDTKAAAASEIGLLFCVLATLTGSLWARSAWGMWWNWDPKQTSILMLILIYGAYFALRSSVEARHTRARLSAAYAILAFVTVPLLMRVIPYYLKGLHPNPVFEGTMDRDIYTLLRLSALGFLGLYLWVFRMRVALGLLEDEREGVA